ncbi:carbohydrate kinase family protein [Chloroflexus sp.]|uniref:carbohydrate kinase family protein n=1 Tax=Chloroflexus sp. TaxID=1904827 RepID=UPI002629728D|nr:carbohydrate kinase family protein [uncultured Chloroflexus sp.]
MESSGSILCYGSICADLHIWLPGWPLPGSGVHALKSIWQAGGNAFNEARALAAWQARPQLYGDRLGFDPAGDLVATALHALDLAAHIERDPAVVTPVCHILITPDGERAIIALREGTAASPPSQAALAASSIVSVSRYGLHTAEVALAARQLNRLVVAGDVSDPAEPLAQAADVIVTSAALLGSDPLARARTLQGARGAPVFLTDSSRPARVLVNNTWHECMPPAQAVTDTTGAGDVFRAGVVYGLWKGWDWSEILAFAVQAATAQLAASARQSS